MKKSEKVLTIDVKEIQVRDGRRELRPAIVKALAESIGAIGQQTPITVARINGTWVLVAGLHRIEAIKALGRSTIKAVRLRNKKGMDRRLWEGSENLHRAELTCLERAEWIDRWRRLLNKKRQAAQVARPGGKQPKDRAVSLAAKELGFSRDEVRRAASIVGINKQIKIEARNAGFGDDQAALLRIAKGDGEQAQRTILNQLVGGSTAYERRPTPAVQVDHQSVVRANDGGQEKSVGIDSSQPSELDIPAAFVRLSERDQQVGDVLMRIWSGAPTVVRRWFLGQVAPAPAQPVSAAACAVASK